MFKKYHAALALLFCDGVGPSDCRKIELRPEEIFEEIKSPQGRKRLSELMDKTVGLVDWDRFERQIKVIERTGADAVCLWDDRYPEYLRHVSSPPPVLFFKGDLERVLRRGVAVVGTRKPSPPGAAMARLLGREISQAGIPVVSGLARGIDSAAHRGSLAGAGGSIAVIGTGLDVPYPPENAELLVDISKHGCVVSEQLMGTTAKAFVFPLRNRLISAMSHAVVVVEAGARSGALITAKWALEQGREVGAVPGFPGDFRSQGVNRLLKQGAFVVEKAIDIVNSVPALEMELELVFPEADGKSEERSGDAGRNDAAATGAAGRDAMRVLAALNKTPTDADGLSSHLGLDVAVVQRFLLHFEMSGRVERDSMGRYTKISL